MDFYRSGTQKAAEYFNSDVLFGLKPETVKKNKEKYGKNKITEKKKQSFFKKALTALSEPMLIILLFSFVVALGVNIGRFVKTGEGDFGECFGILFAVVLSVSITLIMEGSSEKAFNALGKIYDNALIKTIRNGKTELVRQDELVAGDIVILESGDKIVADGRLIKGDSLTVDESALTGESVPVKKQADFLPDKILPLAERKNCLFSGTFVTGGNGKMIITAVGDDTEIGKIAGELSSKKELPSPLQQKLAKLGKIISAVGCVFAVIVFLINVARLIINGDFTFYGVQELFISCIVLIVAAVPEGLPTIVAVSLALNMIKLAKENALIKKMIATETAGAVSVICSDKTGTLTENKMTVSSVCFNEFCCSAEAIKKEFLLQNFVCNSTAEAIEKNGGKDISGSGTEKALLAAAIKSGEVKNVKAYRERFPISKREPFSSEKKYMTTTIKVGGKERTLIKGAPEKVVERCVLTKGQKEKALKEALVFQNRAKRVLCFAHDDGDGYIYDGYAVLSDGIRKEVYKAVKDCKRAGIKVKILTGDNFATAFAVAKELKIAESEREVVNAQELENMDDATLKKALEKITVIARSTPIVKLRIVKALKECGEVVAVTGDGINDAPAIKHADIGISMGKTGSEITKEASDVVLLDDSFATIIKAVSFGRNVYRNLQRFILFQLSVNLSALLFITACVITGAEQPFNTLQLLWINVIMDGPPALTLGLEKMTDKLMDLKPIKRSRSIVTLKMLVRIAFNGVFVAAVMAWQFFGNFLCIPESEKGSVTFTLFIVFQLFNAFNSRELGSQSIFAGFKRNGVMVVTFSVTFLVQILIVTFLGKLFGISPMSALSWVKTVAAAFSIVAVSEVYKLCYRTAFGTRKAKNDKKTFAATLKRTEIA